MTEFISKVISGEYGTSEIVAKLKEIFTVFRESDWMVAAFSFLEGIWASLPYVILLAASVLMIFFGKKLIGLEKFLLCLMLGYIGGSQFLAPVFPESFSIPAWVVGVVIGVIAAVLCKYLYWLFVAAAAGGAGYLVAITYAPKIGGLESFLASGEYNLQIVGGILAAVFIVIVFLLLKYIEMIYTSALGAVLSVVVIVRHLYDFTAVEFFANWGTVSIPGVADVAVSALVAAGILCLLGIITQFATRRRY